MNEVEKLRAAVSCASYRLKPDQMDYLVEQHLQIAKKSFGEDVESYTGSFSFLDGLKALTQCSRVVFGAHGPYVEFDEDDALFEMDIPSYQLWRIESKYAKYYYLEPTGRREKIYLQKREVDYADYKIGKFYIDLYLLRKE